MALWKIIRSIRIKPRWTVNVTVTPAVISGQLGAISATYLPTQPSGLPDIGAYEYQG